jgi:hypothetical protein
MAKKNWHLGLRLALASIALIGCGLLGRAAFLVVRRWSPPNVSEATMRQNLLTAQEIEAWLPGKFRLADKTTEGLTKYQTRGNDVEVAAMYVLVGPSKKTDRLASHRLYHELVFVTDEQAGIGKFEGLVKYVFLLDQFSHDPIPEIAPNADQSAMGCFETRFVKSCKVVLRYKDHVERLELDLPASAPYDAESIIDLVKIIDARPLNQRK